MSEMCVWSDDEVSETLFYDSDGDRWVLERHRFGRELKSITPISIEQAWEWIEYRSKML